MSNHVDDCYTRNKVLTAKLLKPGYKYHKLCKAFPKFLSVDRASKYNVGLKTNKAFRKSEFYGDLACKFRKIIGKMIFIIISKYTVR